MGSDGKKRKTVPSPVKSPKKADQTAAAATANPLAAAGGRGGTTGGGGGRSEGTPAARTKGGGQYDDDEDEEDHEGGIDLEEAFDRVDRNDTAAISATIAEQNERINRRILHLRALADRAQEDKERATAAEDECVKLKEELELARAQVKRQGAIWEELSNARKELDEMRHSPLRSHPHSPLKPQYVPSPSKLGPGGSGGGSAGLIARWQNTAAAAGAMGGGKGGGGGGGGGGGSRSAGGMTAHLTFRSVPVSSLVDSPPLTKGAAAGGGTGGGQSQWSTATVWHDVDGASSSSSSSSSSDNSGVVLYPTQVGAASVLIPHASMSRVEAFYTNDPNSGEEVAAFRVVAGELAHEFIVEGSVSSARWVRALQSAGVSVAAA